MKRVPIAIWLIILAACLVACGSEGAPVVVTPTLEGERGPTPPTATPPASTDFERVSIVAADGVTLIGAFYSPESRPAPGILLLHMLGRQKEDWASFATHLQTMGYAVLALDLRGHGESGGEMDWALMPEDVHRAWAVLADRPEVDPQQTFIVGASIGANLALMASAGEPQVRGAVLLSPGLDYRGVRTEEAMAAFGERPVLIVASQDDSYAAESSQTLVELAQGDPVLTLYAEAGHGTAMFDSQPDLVDLILGWLRSQH